MVKLKLANKIQLKLLFLYLAFFPFGQLIRLGSFHPTDFIVFLSAILFIFTKNKKYPEIAKSGKNMLFIFLFSFVFSLTLFRTHEVVIGGLYLLRFFAYILFGANIYNVKKTTKTLTPTIIDSLILLGFITAVFGLLQYFFIPDLRALYALGWDDHYYRLTSTFLDPAFTGIILVITQILLYFRFKTNKRALFILSGIILLSLLLTYSRSSYLALLISFLFIFKSKIRLITLLSSVFIMFIILLSLISNSGGEGVNLIRTRSITLKIENYTTSLGLIAKNPLLGVGFDNICVAKYKLQPILYDSKSHSCSGLDNSFLFLLATTGITGFMLTSQFFMTVLKNLKSSHRRLIQTVFLAICVHSLFTNTLFYPWILGILALLIGASLL